MKARTGLWQITAAAMLWGTAGVVVQWVHRWTGLDPLGIGAYRLAISTVAMLALTARRWSAMGPALRRHPLGVVTAGVGLAAYQALYFVGVTQAGVTVATMISLGLAPVVTAVWESIAERRVPRLLDLITVAAAILGLALLAAGQRHGSAGPHPAAGIVASAGSGLVYGLAAVLARHLSQSVPALTLTTLMSAVGAASLVPVAAFAGLGLHDLTGDGLGRPLLALVYMGVFTTAVAYALFNSGLRSTRSSVAAVLTLLEALTAAILAVALLAEPLAALTAIGGVLMLSAVAILYLAPRPPEQTAPH